MFLGKCVLKICSKFTGKHLCRSVVSVKLLSNFIKVTLRHGCSPVHLLHIFRTPFLENTYGWLLLNHCNNFHKWFFLKVDFKSIIRTRFIIDFFIILMVSINPCTFVTRNKASFVIKCHISLHKN